MRGELLLRPGMGRAGASAFPRQASRYKAQIGRRKDRVDSQHHLRSSAFIPSGAVVPARDGRGKEASPPHASFGSRRVLRARANSVAGILLSKAELLGLTQRKAHVRNRGAPCALKL